MNTQLLPPIVTVEELVGRTDVVLCDVRWYLDRTPGRNKYNEGHIPGSIFVDLDEHLATLPRKSEDVTHYPQRRRSQQVWGHLGLAITTLLSHTTTVAACQPAVWCGCSGFSVTTQPYLMEDYRGGLVTSKPRHTSVAQSTIRSARMAN